VAGRTRQEIQSLIGYMINTMPIRCLPAEDGSFADMISAAGKAMLAALDHSVLPLEDIVAVSGVPRIPNANPLFQVLFQFLPESTMGADFSLGNIIATPLPQQPEQSQAKMDLVILMAGDKVIFEFMSELYEADTIERLFGSWIGVLQHVLSSGGVDSKWNAVSLLRPEDKAVIKEVSRGTARPEFMEAPLVHQQFELIAAAQPDRVCLVYEDEELSFKEVNERANKLAHELVSMGVEREVIVGVMVERSFDLIISMLAILKAGGKCSIVLYSILYLLCFIFDCFISIITPPTCVSSTTRRRLPLLGPYLSCPAFGHVCGGRSCQSYPHPVTLGRQRHRACCWSSQGGGCGFFGRVCAGGNGFALQPV
jgi:non-ribosomal peptide synthetase component F